MEGKRIRAIGDTYIYVYNLLSKHRAYLCVEDKDISAKLYTENGIHFVADGSSVNECVANLMFQVIFHVRLVS